MCDDMFNDNSADAICREMGHSGASAWDSGYHYSYEQLDRNITLDNVECDSDNWDLCSYETTHDCRHNEDVFLTCLPSGEIAYCYAF